MKLLDKMKRLRSEKKGLLATNFYNLETLQGVLSAAKELQQPIILQLTASSIQYMGLRTVVSLARTGLKEYGVEGWLHLDHGHSVDLVQSCLDEGFDSVMIDGSELSFQDNIKITKEVVARASNYGAAVEAELGYVAKLGQSHTHQGFTQVDEAKTFVYETGVDTLAVAIGTAHGFYKEVPSLQFGLLADINAAVDAILVLHGGSGVPADQLRKAISLGICKINLATEIKNIFMKTLQHSLHNNEEIDLRKVFPVATGSVVELVKEKLTIVQNLESVYA